LPATARLQLLPHGNFNSKMNQRWRNKLRREIIQKFQQDEPAMGSDRMKNASLFHLHHIVLFKLQLTAKPQTAASALK
jgi:hypothetical protein